MRALLAAMLTSARHFALFGFAVAIGVVWVPIDANGQPGRRRPPDRRRDPPAVNANPTEDEAASLDDRLTSDVQLSRGLQSIEAFIEREKWPEVVAGLQALIEGPEGAADTFGKTSRGEWRSLQRLAIERLRTLPEPGRRLYVEVYGGVAQELLSQARTSGDLQRLIDVARRFLATAAGEAAAVDVAMTYFDRADYLATVRWMEALSPERRATVVATAQLKYALALAAAGRAADAERVIEMLPGPSQSDAARSLMVESLRDWWRTGSKPSLAANVTLQDWPMFYGDPTRSGSVRGGSPLLLEQWSHPMTTLPVVQDQIEALHTDLRDAGRACIPSQSAAILGHRVAVRTLRGVEVVDLSTGEVLWTQAIDPAAPDRLLSGTFTGQGEARAQQMRVAAQAQYSAQEAGNFDQHPLTGYLFQDTVNGTLSGDDQQLFVLTNHAVLGRTNPGYWVGGEASEADPFGRDWSSNVITAYDLEHGDIQWQIGGARSGESFDRPLAGTYFCGPPTPAEDELYVIGERDNELVLFVLDRRTGHPVLTQPLANAQSGIAVDTARRMWACAPAISQGIVVCPTTTGWTVAVDRMERRLLWAHFSETTPADQRRNNFRGALMQPLQPLNVRWETSPPIISGRHVVIAPQELPDAFHSNEPAVICLDLATGKEQWRQPKQDDGLYVAGVQAELVLVVGRSRLRALVLSTGREAWAVTLPADGPPSGRGLISGDDYVLPLANGQLWRVQVQSGTVLERLELADGARPLGNLAMSRGMLVSVDPLSIRGFNEQSALEAEIAARRRLNPRDLWATIQEAELARMHGEREQAIALLDAARDVAADPQTDARLVGEFQQLRLNGLMALVQSDLRQHDVEFEQLRSEHDLRANPRLRRLAVERGLARGEGAAVWPLLWPPTSGAAAREVIALGPLEVTTTTWEAGRLASLYAAADDALRDVMDATFHEYVEGLIADKVRSDEQLRAEQLLAFHAEGRRLTAALAEAAETAGDFAGAEIRWRRLSQAGRDGANWQAGLRLARWLAKHEQPLDAERVLSEWTTRIETLDADSQAPAREALAQTAVDLQLDPLAAQALSPGWTDESFSVSVRARTREEAVDQEATLTPGREAFYETHQFEFQAQQQRLRITTADGTEYWSLPLRSQQRPVFDQTAGLRTDGLQAYSIWQGVIQALSLPDRKVRWSFPIDLRLSGANYARNIEADEKFGLLPANQFIGQWGLRRYHAPTGMAAAATPEYVLLHGRRAISLLDALTGEVRWTRSGLAPQSMVYGDDDRIYGFPADGSEPFVLRASDGEELPHDVLNRHVRQAISIRDGLLTALTASSGRSILGFFTPQSVVTGIDLETGETRWTASLDGQSRLGWLSDDELLVVDSRQAVSTLNVVSGERRQLGVLPGDVPRDNAPVQRLVDRESIYLLFDRDWKRQSYFMNLPHQQINGLVVCVARDGSGVRWHRRIEEQRLLTSQFDRSPVLVFFNQLDDDNLHQLQIAMWDKQTGRPLLESSDVRTSQQTFQLEQDFAHRTIRFVGHSLQVVVGPGTERPASPQAPTLEPVDPAAKQE